jgi:alpha-tubulin suppressor-like RCC1 family protein
MVECGGTHSAILRNGNVYLSGMNNQKQSSLPQIEYSQAKIINVSCGRLHTAVLLDNGHIRLFGNNDKGKCSLP